MSELPRYAILHNTTTSGIRVRVLNYHRDSVWRVLEPGDIVKFVHSSRLTFLP